MTNDDGALDLPAFLIGTLDAPAAALHAHIDSYPTCETERPRLKTALGLVVTAVLSLAPPA